MFCKVFARTLRAEGNTWLIKQVPRAGGSIQRRTLDHVGGVDNRKHCVLVAYKRYEGLEFA